MPRFVVLHHVMPPDAERTSHWDLMLQMRNCSLLSEESANKTLRTWEMPNPIKRAQTVLARRLPDHRDVYLEYEGDLSDGRGAVERVMEGLVRWIEETDDKYVIQLETSEQVVFDIVIIRKDGDQFSISIK